MHQKLTIKTLDRQMVVSEPALTHVFAQIGTRTSKRANVRATTGQGDLSKRCGSAGCATPDAHARASNTTVMRIRGNCKRTLPAWRPGLHALSGRRRSGSIVTENG